MANKLYFDVHLSGSQTNRSVLATAFTAGSPGDRYGSLLQPLESCTTDSPLGVQRSRAVSAWFQPVAIEGQNATTSTNLAFAVRFVQPTVPGANQSGLQSLQGVGFNADGAEAIYGTAGTLRNFSVQVQKRKAAGGTISVSGVLYVQRQHSIEV